MKFRVPSADPETLLQDVIFSFWISYARIADPRAWLVGAINASRAYWRIQSRVEQIDSGTLARFEEGRATDPDQLEREMLVRAVLIRLRAPDRELLLLHYFEQMTAREIAEHTGMTLRYTEKRIVIALRRALMEYVALAKLCSEKAVADQESPRKWTE